MKYYQVGGQETVTNVLAHKFIEEGYNVFIASFTELSPIMIERADKRIQFYTLDGFCASTKNVATLRKILIDEKISVVINQWGLPYISTKIVKKAKHALNIIYISVYHNDPNTNGRLKKVEQQLSKEQLIIKRWILKAKWQIIRIITGLSMNYVYRYSDVYVLLSKSFLKSFRKFAFLNNTSKVAVIANPLTVDLNDDKNIVKLKEILFVGRLVNIQKRVDRILDIWSLIHKKYCDWKLVIVGDGEDRKILERKAQDLQLKNIEFTGYKAPIEYYKRTSILLLTSDYEGFPLVLAEAMNFGAVPCVYNCCSAIYDIINDSINGFVIPKDVESAIPYKIAEKIEMLITSPELLKQMSTDAIKKSKMYSLDEIFKAWDSIMKGR